MVISGTWNAVKIKVIGNKPHTLKLTQNSSDWVLQTISFNKANEKKKIIHLLVRIFQPSSARIIDFPKIFFKIGSFVKYLPNSRAKPKRIFIIVG